jgi:hypothetical protein
MGRSSQRSELKAISNLNMNDKKRRKDRCEILLEKLSNKIDLILKIHKEFGKKFDEAKKERQEIRNDLTTKIEFVAKSLNKKIEDTEKRLGGKIDRIGSGQDTHGSRIEVLEKKLSI